MRLLTCYLVVGNSWQTIWCNCNSYMQTRELLRAQLAVSVEEEDGMPVDATGRLFALVTWNDSDTSVLSLPISLQHLHIARLHIVFR